MVEWHGKSKRLSSGGMRTTRRRCTKKEVWKGGEAALTKCGKEERETKKGIGNTSKVRVTSVKYVNVLDKKTDKTKKYEVINVKTNDANRLFARTNIITKGAVLRIKVGAEEKLAKVTSRPGQDGVVNAIFE
ncbi:MAG: 30S ribosomal protein S8e [Candidatus Diapherotrites archaeon]|nr:30S ribosomal protein S8e [Candidatus Diapherotrites archaeon]